MNTSGEAAEQIVRMTLQMGEAALKITGAGAKQLAVILYAISREQKKSKGKARMETMLRSGRPLTVFSIKDSDVKTFVKAARKYGVLYCAVRNPVGRKDNMVDLIVKQEDAARINRIVERFQLASVPFPGRTERELLSEPISGRQTRTGRTISKPASAEKSSVRQELKEIRDQRQKKSSQKNRRRPPVQKRSQGKGR